MKCEACLESEAQSNLKIVSGGKPYKLCLNCLSSLNNLCLTPEQFKNLIDQGHKDNEFYLHGDFYDEEGYALQPRKFIE